MKKVMIFMIVIYIVLFLVIVIAKLFDVTGILIMLLVLLLLVTPLVINDLVIDIRLKKASSNLAKFKYLERSRRDSYKVLRNILVSKHDATYAKLNIATFQLLRGNFKEYQKWIDEVEFTSLTSKKLMIIYLALKKDYYFIIDDKAKYDEVVNFIKENTRELSVELKNDLDSDLFIFDLRQGFVDYKHEEKMLNYLKSYVDLSLIYDLTYHYALALIQKCRHQRVTEREYLDENSKGTFFTHLLSDLD